jgi:DNA-binding LacI/PurR family transcriptional regulator
MPTIADVAKLAGVSTGTVSRVMNGAENIHPNTRSKVEQAIANLGYQPNFQARSLRSKRTDTIALAIPELTNYFWTTIARGRVACKTHRRRGATTYSYVTLTQNSASIFAILSQFLVA